MHLDGKGLTNIRVSGLQEVFETGTEKVAQTAGKEFRVAYLAGIVLLKLVAYDDRPEKRFKDARDIANIIENYFDLQTDLIYEEHNDIFAVDDGALDQLLLEEIAAEVLGREIKEIVKDNLELLRRVQNILAGNGHPPFLCKESPPLPSTAARCLVKFSAAFELRKTSAISSE